jgi:transposase
MKLKNIDITEIITKARKHLSEDTNISAATKSVIDQLILIIEVLLNRFGATSKNSNKPPSQDPNRKKNLADGTSKKPGAQVGHVGKTLVQSDTPDEIVPIKIKLETLPEGIQITHLDSERRQVFDVRIKIHVTEYQAQVLRDADGNIYKAEFPKGVTAPVQYGPSVRGLSCYMSNYQFVPFLRIVDFFEHQVGLPVSAGTIVNINAEAAEALSKFALVAKENLIKSDLLHADETGLNIAGKNAWLHSASNNLWSLFVVSTKRGNVGMDDIGILLAFRGILVHDNWAPYFKYECEHAICNAHQVRELTRIVEVDGFSWAKKMIEFLYAAKKEIEETANVLSKERLEQLFLDYDAILELGDKECPQEEKSASETPKRGRTKKSKARNLIDRLRDKKTETLRFLTNPTVPFTNNQAENDIRMTKVQQKISGCHKSLKTANDACLIRSFISTCQKHGVCVSIALNDLFQGRLPPFCAPPT